MKITDIKAFVTKPPGAFSNYVFVKVSTDEGVVGWGESSIGATSVAAVIEEFGAAIIGKDPFRIEEHWQDMYHLHHNIRGGALQMAAISGIEIALWDIKGKALNVPVYELLGGAMRDKLWTYGRFDGVDPAAAVENAMSFVEDGYTALKGDPFGHQGIFTSPRIRARRHSQGRGRARRCRRRRRAASRGAWATYTRRGNQDRGATRAVPPLLLRGTSPTTEH